MAARRATRGRRTAAVLLSLAAVALPIRGWSEPLDGLRPLHAADQRLADVAFRLARAGGDLCPSQAPLLGLVVEDASQFAANERDRFGAHREPVISAVAERGPAAAAGLRPGDTLVAINDAPLPPSPASTAEPTAERVDRIRQSLATAAASGAVGLTIRRAEAVHEIRFVPSRGCAGDVQVTTSGEIEGYADGATAEVSLGALGAAKGEDEVAALVAHEMAHNILRHPQRLAAAHVGSGRSRRGAALTLATEIEADLLSLYLLDRAGYDPDAPARFWARMAARGEQRQRQRSHLPADQRARMLAGEAAVLRRLTQGGDRPRPVFPASGLPPLR